MVDRRQAERLAELVSGRARLYAVGGYCRDTLLGVPPRDLDICSELPLDEFKKTVEGHGFVVSDKSYRLGTASVSAEGFRAEYTAFRTDSYPEGSGAHRPDSVVFTSDMRLDAARRDFTVNAVYQDLASGEWIDFFGGREDIRRGVLRAVREPDLVFGEDGLRVLRLARFAGELGFSPESATLDAARRNAPKIKDVARERVLEELDKIFVADTAYPALGVVDGHVRGLEVLDATGALDILLPELAALKGMPQPAKYHIYDGFRHSVEAYRVAPPSVRWAALLHDVGKKPALERQGNMHGHAELGAELVSGRLAALGMPARRAERVTALVGLHMTDLKGDMSEGKLRVFIATHAGLMEELAALMRADAYATRGVPVGEPRIEKLYRSMLEDGTPFSVADLPVNGVDAERAGLKGRRIGDALDALWKDAVLNPVLRERGHALAYLEKRAAKEKDDERK